MSRPSKHMSWSWERRIRHIDRRVSPLELQGMRLRLLRIRVREQRGLPSNTVPSELVFDEDLTPQRAAWLRLRHRLLERKRIARIRAMRSRRKSIADTGIFGVRRRAEGAMRQAATDNPELPSGA